MKQLGSMIREWTVVTTLVWLKSRATMTFCRNVMKSRRCQHLSRFGQNMGNNWKILIKPSRCWLNVFSFSFFFSFFFLSSFSLFLFPPHVASIKYTDEKHVRTRLEDSPRRPGSAPVQPNSALGASRECPRSALERPESVQERSRGVPEPPRNAPDRPRCGPD